MWRLVFHGVFRRRWQSAATMFAVAVGVALLLAALLLRRSVSAGLEQSRARLGADLLVLPFHSQADVNEALFSGSPLNVYMDRQIETRARATPGVSRVDAQFFTQTLTLDCCAVGEEIRLVGIEPESVARFARLSPDGASQLGDDQIIVGGQLSSRLGWKGSKVALLGDVFQIAFVLESTGTGLDESILMPIATARKLAARSRPLRDVWKEQGSPQGLVSALLIEVADSGQIDAVAAALEQNAELRVLRPAQAFQRIRLLVDAFTWMLAAAALVAAAASIVHLVSHVSAGVWDRKGDWALYRALGGTRVQLIGLVAAESLVLSLGGAAVGLPLGLVLYGRTLARLLARNSFASTALGGPVIAAALLATLAAYAAIGLLAAIGPALRIAKLEPGLIMAQGSVDP